MKAAFIGGEFHAQTLEIPRENSEIYYPKIQATIVDLIQIPKLERTAAEAYWIQPLFTIETEHGIELAIFTHALTTIANRPDVMLRAQTLHCIARLLSVSVGLNRWLDADLQHHLFPARVPFDLAINQLEGRNNNERLARRFPETFED